MTNDAVDMNSKAKILKELQIMLETLFEITPNDIRLETRLYDDLDLDSIDAVDLIVQLQEVTKRKFKPEEFKTVRTVSDVVEVIYNVLKEPENKQ
jgi:acyl carrier protein